MPETTYEAKNVVCSLGLEAQKMHACPNDCILYRGEYEKLDSCPVCNACLYKIPRDDPGDVEGDVCQEEGACQGDVAFPSNTTSETFVHEQNECEIDAMAQKRT